ncbi:MAG: hypothetical protein DMD91_01200 [Candidatus Rokuibacteriota bacterium]|nr:MAG: hypothetical protein DMD91_01200 [Candidatus Rokubacteria bacterium]
MIDEANGSRLRFARGTWWPIAAVLAVFVVVVLVAGVFYRRSARLEADATLATNQALARAVADLIEAREERYRDLLLSYAGRFRFREAIEQRDRSEALRHLRQISESFPGIGRPFLSDPAGVLWAAYPEVPKLYGQRFADRDWYRGVSRNWEPYVSEVYESAAEDRALLVVLAVPIRNPAGQVIGIIGVGQRLQVVREWLLPVEIPGGDFYVVDRKGQFVFHRTRARPAQAADYAHVPAVQRLLAGETGIAETQDPVEGEVRLIAYRTLPSLGWGVVVHRSKSGVLHRMHTLVLVAAAVAFALTTTLAGIGGLALRNERRVAAALATSTERLQILHEIDRALIAAKAPVEIAESVLPRLRDLLDVPRAIVNLFDLATGEVEWLAAVGRRRFYHGAGIRYSLRLAGDVEALRRGEPQVIDVQSLSPSPETDALLASDVRVYMVVPMITRDELIGSISFGGPTGEFPPERVRIAQEVAAQLAIAITQARLQERVARHAEELEARVQERTRELSSTNEYLQREITERRLAEEEADRANRTKSEFLSRMSHELRTPLNAILGFGQVLEMDSLDAEQRDSVAHVLAAGRHLLGLIDEVLDIARIEAGRLTLSLEPVDMRTVLDEVRSLIRPLAAGRRLEVRAENPPADALYVLADRQRLKQVLLNLLSNAVKYNREAGSIRVWCDTAPENRLRLNVRDTGPGIPPDKLGQLFTPFERLGAEATAISGTGLGLALSKGLVDAMGGAIGVESTPGQGSLFWVELRRAETPEADREALEEVEASGLRAVRGTVLYVEDNLSNLQLIERLLARRPGIKLLSAMQGRIGLDLAREHRPGLILLDLHLPDVHGSEVLRRLRQDAGTRDIPVVIISADASPREVERLRAAGARDYLTKPIDVRRFLVIVDEMLAPELRKSDG